MFRTANRPGERVMETGIYWVHHYAHRISHPALLHAGHEFPRCHVCGGKVRFEKTSQGTPRKAGAAPPIETFNDFSKVA
jgi:hypothetical protein